MSESKIKTKEVFPGAFLTTEEEYLPGANTFEDSKGNIYSSGIGKPKFDSSKREVSVQAKKQQAKPVGVGTTVICQVSVVRDSVAFVGILNAEDKGKERKIINSFATLRVAEVCDKYVESMRDMFRVGDIVRAVVIDVKPYGITLTTKGTTLGVLKAYCSKCRKPLHQFGGDLKCLQCNNSETRKIAPDYSLR